MLIKAGTSSGAHLDGSEPWLGPLGGVWWSHRLKATRPGPWLREMLQAQAPFMATPGSGQGQGPGPHEAGAASSRAGQVGPGQPLPGQLGDVWLSLWVSLQSCPAPLFPSHCAFLSVPCLHVAHNPLHEVTRYLSAVLI